ncbi:hypothetical protein OsI_31386 [Oryza sativa Indica Group]|uniref:Uncharacterized protein n=1 Tax=Oryza sativa subsp. indica TaxID=39946 RepID=A2Z1A8_ORYSI|nr:hypothetical protein OsI_31386 [Oryza sativa Indica Group]
MGSARRIWSGASGAVPRSRRAIAHCPLIELRRLAGVGVGDGGPGLREMEDSDVAATRKLVALMDQDASRANRHMDAAAGKRNNGPALLCGN